MSECTCKRCGDPVEVHGSSWCTECWYPGIDDVFREFQDMLAEGYRRADAAVRSGWMGAEEI